MILLGLNPSLIYLLTQKEILKQGPPFFIPLFIMLKFKSKLREVTAVYKPKENIANVKIGGSRDVNDYIRSVYPVSIEIREAMLVLLLNNSNRTLGYSIASIGGITGTLVDVRLVLRDALLTQSTALILIHNHPSGTLKPSQADISITTKVKRAAEVMDIKLLDHLILTEDSYYSFADEGKL